LIVSIILLLGGCAVQKKENPTRQLEEFKETNANTAHEISITDVTTIRPNLDLSWIMRLANLQTILLNGFTINDVSPLVQLPKLENVDFYRSHWKNEYSLLASESIRQIFITGSIIPDRYQEFRKKEIVISPMDDRR
jgi:Leucine-rich repeat (LRR) protein